MRLTRTRAGTVRKMEMSGVSQILARNRDVKVTE